MNAEESDKTPCMCASNFRGFPNNHFPVFPTRCNEAPVVRDLDTGYSSIMCKNLGEHLSTKQIPDQKTSRTATRENRGTIPAETSVKTSTRYITLICYNAKVIFSKCDALSMNVLKMTRRSLLDMLLDDLQIFRNTKLSMCSITIKSYV